MIYAVLRNVNRANSGSAKPSVQIQKTHLLGGSIVRQADTQGDCFVADAPGKDSSPSLRTKRSSRTENARVQPTSYGSHGFRGSVGLSETPWKLISWRHLCLVNVFHASRSSIGFPSGRNRNFDLTGLWTRLGWFEKAPGGTYAATTAYQMAILSITKFLFHSTLAACTIGTSIAWLRISGADGQRTLDGNE